MNINVDASFAGGVVPVRDGIACVTGRVLEITGIPSIGAEEDEGRVEGRVEGREEGMEEATTTATGVGKLLLLDLPGDDGGEEGIDEGRTLAVGFVMVMVIGTGNDELLGVGLLAGGCGKIREIIGGIGGKRGDFDGTGHRIAKEALPNLGLFDKHVSFLKGETIVEFSSLHNGSAKKIIFPSEQLTL